MEDARIILLLKPNKKPSLASSYRPISLLPTISKLIERIIYKRIKNITEDRNIIPEHQFGFRNAHSTTQQLIRVTEDIINNFNISTATGAILLDIAKAFDRVWHDGILYKLIQHNYPYWIIKLISNYLKSRKIETYLNDEISTRREIRAGVPQGSILGPLLFNIYISDMPELSNCKLAQFADDTIIYTHHRNPKSLQLRLQKDTDKIMKWFNTWKIKINEDKTEAIQFAKKKKRKPPPININNTDIAWTEEVKYLGIKLDAKMTFKKHIKDTKKICSQLIGCLYPLIGRKSKMSTENKLTIIRAIMIPKITYGSEAWAIANPKSKQALQVEINKTARIIINAPWYITNEQIRKELKIETLEEIIHKRSTLPKKWKHTTTH